jgi:enoyl-CoA hydratase/carnithine racemase
MNFETLLYEERNHVAWVTLNRPEVHNAFNIAMQRELQTLWRDLRGRDEVHAVVLTGAGDKAFTTGIDRSEILDAAPAHSAVGSAGEGPFMFDDPGTLIGPKSNDLWKPVVCAVNGMACGGAFYFLGEVDIIIAAEHATFFDPHVTYGMASSFESMHILQRLPLGEVLRLQLLGNHERMSARRAYEVGMVSEVVPGEKLSEAAAWVAETIAGQPPLAVQGTLRAVWAAQDQPRQQALAQAFAYVKLGNDADSLRQGQESFRSGERPEPRIR